MADKITSDKVTPKQTFPVFVKKDIEYLKERLT